MNRVRSCKMALGLAAALLLALAAYGQSDYGSIAGFVKDPSGGVIPKSKVNVKNEATGAEHPVTTNDSGYYVVPNLPPGFYSVSAEAPGFKKFDKTHIKLDANSALSVDAPLVVGSSTETVEVVADARSCKPSPERCRVK